MTERIFLSSPHMSGNEKSYIDYAFDSNWIAPLGPNVDGFEREIAKYAQVEDAAATSSGTAAIHLALELLEVGKDDIVFCSTLTFIASANPILYTGATPVFIDSEESTWNMSPVALEKALKDAKQKDKLPKAVIIVHLYGQSAMLDELMAICERYGVPIVEDAAESLGSYYKGQPSGSFGKFGIFSFNGNKIITTSGGGMLISNDVQALKRARFLATQARDQAVHYQHSVVGYNYRLSNILAGVGRAQLEVLADRVLARRAVFNRYVEALGDIDGLNFMPELENTYGNRWLTTLTLDPEKISTTPGEIIEVLAEENIEARPVWKPLHLQPLFDGTDFYPHSDEEIISEKLFERGLCLPSGSNMTEEQQSRVISKIQQCLGVTTSASVTK
ncbi:aminotransferase class I/II-fold pyridoxal phosphate-dependent enzyme [Planococcus sp. SIMBA_143]